jgi:transcriptional regulator with XRE-family HTH domain
MRKTRENLPEISRLLRQIRIDAQLTQADAASKIGIAMLTLSRVENGDMRITARNLEKILNFYDLTLSAKLIGESEEKSESAPNLPKW